MMWPHRDSSLKKRNGGNIYIKNLEKSVDSIAFYDTFSTFGNVLSYKMVCDENGSRGYGYVQFEIAMIAVKRVNGMLFNDRKVFIALMSCQEHVNSKEVNVSQMQEKEEGHSKLTCKFKQYMNLCVKNLDVSVHDKGLQKEFSPFGTIINSKTQRWLDPVAFLEDLWLSASQLQRKPQRPWKRCVERYCSESHCTSPWFSTKRIDRFSSPARRNSLSITLNWTTTNLHHILATSWMLFLRLSTWLPVTHASNSSSFAQVHVWLRRVSGYSD